MCSENALLHTTVVMRGYFCYCDLPVSFDQSGTNWSVKQLKLKVLLGRILRG